jgi:hypothetical protein
MMNLRAIMCTFVTGLPGTAILGQPVFGNDRFESPVPIRVDGQVLELPDRLAAPALGDIDGDGRRDLLVGQHRGRMRVFQNIGTDARPEFDEPVWFDEMVAGDQVPTGNRVWDGARWKMVAGGRIPTG